MKRCIAVDFDGTLAQYEGYRGPGVYGEPVLSMLEKVRRWLAEGHEVVIFTARVAIDDRDATHAVLLQEHAAIQTWLRINGLPKLEVTCMKKKKFTEIWDDRAIAVERNTGRWFGFLDGARVGVGTMRVEGDVQSTPG